MSSTDNLKCCVENQSDFFYGDLDWFSNKFPKFIINLCRNLNKSSITLINYLGNKLIILHVFTCVQSYIYICTRMYTTLICSVHKSIRMNTTPEIISEFEDLVQCSICKTYTPKNQWNYHKKDHRYEEDGRNV